MSDVVAAVAPGDALYEQVLRRAHGLAVGGRLTILAVHERPLSWVTDRIRTPEAQTADAREAVAVRIRNDLDRLGLDRVSFPVDVRVPLATHSNPGADVVDHLKAIQPDVVVIGTHGRTGMQAMFIGSVAEHVVRHAPCDTFVVRR